MGSIIIASGENINMDNLSKIGIIYREAITSPTQQLFLDFSCKLLHFPLKSIKMRVQVKYSDIGRRICRAFDHAPLQEIAAKLDIKYKTFWRYIAGLSPPPVDVLKKIREETGISVDYLLFGEDTRRAIDDDEEELLRLYRRAKRYGRREGLWDILKVYERLIEEEGSGRQSHPIPKRQASGW